MLTVATTPVAHDLEPSQHLSHAEETNSLSANHSCGSHRFPVHVSYPGEDALRAVGSGLRSALGSLLGGSHEA